MAHKADGTAREVQAGERAVRVHAAEGLGALKRVQIGVDDGHALARLLKVPGEQGLGGHAQGKALQRRKAPGYALARGVHADAAASVGEQRRGPGDAVDDAGDREPCVGGDAVEQQIVKFIGKHG